MKLLAQSELVELTSFLVALLQHRPSVLAQIVGCVGHGLATDIPKTKEEQKSTMVLNVI